MTCHTITGTGNQTVNGVSVVVTDTTVTPPVQIGNNYSLDLGTPNDPENVRVFSLTQSGTNIGLNLPQSATLTGGRNSLRDTMALNLRNAGATNVVVPNRGSGNVATFTTTHMTPGNPGTTITYDGLFFPTGQPPGIGLGPISSPVVYVGPAFSSGSPQIRSFQVNNTTNSVVSFATTSGLTFEVPANTMSPVMAAPAGSADESWSFVIANPNCADITLLNNFLANALTSGTLVNSGFLRTPDNQFINLTPTGLNYFNNDLPASDFSGVTPSVDSRAPEVVDALAGRDNNDRNLINAALGAAWLQGFLTSERPALQRGYGEGFSDAIDAIPHIIAGTNGDAS